MLKTSLSLVPSSILALLKRATFILGAGSKTQLSKALNSLVWSRWEVGPESSQDYLPPKSSMMQWELCWAPEMTVETILPVVGAELAGCHGNKVPVSASPSALLLFSLAAWLEARSKKSHMRWLLRHIVSCTVGLQWIGIVQGRATWADFSALGYIYPLSLVIGL